MADPTPDEVQRFIAQGLACEHIDVEGDGRHFFATIVSVEFEGTTRVKPVTSASTQALGDRMREPNPCLVHEDAYAGRMGHNLAGSTAARARRGLRTPPPLTDRPQRSLRLSAR